MCFRFSCWGCCYCCCYCCCCYKPTVFDDNSFGRIVRSLVRSFGCWNGWSFVLCCVALRNVAGDRMTSVWVAFVLCFCSPCVWAEKIRLSVFRLRSGKTDTAEKRVVGAFFLLPRHAHSRIRTFVTNTPGLPPTHHHIRVVQQERPEKLPAHTFLFSQRSRLGECMVTRRHLAAHHIIVHHCA